MHKYGGLHARLSVLGVCVSLGVGLTAITASAQEGEPAEMSPPAQTEGSADAGSTRARQLKLDEVVVTAQKRSQDVQEVPISITAVSGEELRDMNIQGVTELTILMPNATLAVSPTFATIYVRGIGTGLNDGFEPSVGLYVDGIYLARQTYLNDSMMDIESVELLRGPQGTLFGKNTVAGALQITNAVPTYEWFGTLDVMYGEKKNKRATGALNVPIIDDKLAIRVSGQRHKSEGAIYNKQRDVHELRADKASGRIKARLDITNDLYLTSAFEISHVKDTGQGFELFKATTESQALMTLFNPDNEGIPDRVSYLDADNFADRKTKGANLNVFWTIGGHELALIAGYNRFNEKLFYDSDAGPVPLLTWYNDDDYAQWQAELRVVSPPGQFEYIGGLFYFGNQYDAFTEFRQFDDEDLVGRVASGALSPILGDMLIDILTPITGLLTDLSDVVTQDALFQNFEQSTDTYAIYGQVTYRPWTWLELIGGVRGHYEKKTASISQDFESTGAFLNAAFGTMEYSFDGDESETSVTPKFAVRYLLNDTINIYATVGSGYKAGGFNPTAPDPSKTQFDKETSWTYEAGIKSELLDRRIIANLAAFRTEFKDMQISVLSGAGEAFFVDNAAASTVQGFEWDIKAILWEGNLLSFAGGFLHAYYDEFQRGPCRAGQEGDADGFCDMTGERLVRAPKWDLSGSIVQAIPLGNWPVGMFVGLNWAMQTKHFTDLDNDINTQQDLYHVLNVQVGIGDVDQRWSLSVNGHNVLNTDIKGGVTDVPLFEGAYFGILAPSGFWTAEFRLTL